MRPNYLTVLTLSLCLAALAGCDSNSEADAVGTPDSASDQDLAGTGDTDTACPRGENPLTVTSHVLDGHTLTLDVAFPDTCASHQFEVWWSGAAATSDPPLLPLEFHHFVTGQTCEGTGSAVVIIDLSTLNEAAGPPSNALRLQFIPAWAGSQEFLPEILYNVVPQADAAIQGAISVLRECGGITG